MPGAFRRQVGRASLACARLAGDPRRHHLHRALAASEYPKVLFAGNPGALVSPEFAERFAAGLHHCRVVQLDPGAHFLQEDHPDTIARAVVEMIEASGGRSRSAAA